MLNDTNGKPMTAPRVVIQLLKAELSIDDSHIWLSNQNRKVPNDDGLYFSVGMVDSQIIGNNRRTEATDTGMSETQTIISQENIQIDMFSRGDDAEFRRWEVVSALRSVYAQQLQEKNQFRIFQIPSSFINSSSAEGGSNINRFSVIVPCHVWYKKTKALSTPLGDYFDKFDNRVDDAKTITEDSGLIEFSLADWLDSMPWIDYEEWIEDGTAN